MASEKRRLSDVEELLKAGGYIVRYERGHFRAGYCIVNERRIIVINKFFETRARLNKLVELLDVVELKPENFSEQQRELLETLLAKLEDSHTDAPG